MIAEHAANLSRKSTIVLQKMLVSVLKPAVRKHFKICAFAWKLETDTEFRIETVLFCAGCELAVIGEAECGIFCQVEIKPCFDEGCIFGDRKPEDRKGVRADEACGGDRCDVAIGVPPRDPPSARNGSFLSCNSRACVLS